LRETVDQKEAPQLAEKERQRAVYEKAKAARERERRRKEAAGYAVMAAAYTLEPASRGVGIMGRLVNWSQMGCILFAGFAPNYLVWRLLLQG